MAFFLNAEAALGGVQIVPEEPLFQRGGKGGESLDGKTQRHLEQFGDHFGFQIYRKTEQGHAPVFHGKGVDFRGAVQGKPEDRGMGVEGTQMLHIQPAKRLFGGNAVVGIPAKGALKILPHTLFFPTGQQAVGIKFFAERLRQNRPFRGVLFGFGQGLGSFGHERPPFGRLGQQPPCSLRHSSMTFRKARPYFFIFCSPTPDTRSISYSSRGCLAHISRRVWLEKMT